MFRVCYQFLIAIGLFFLETNKETSNSAHEASDKNVIKWWMKKKATEKS